MEGGSALREPTKPGPVRASRPDRGHFLELARLFHSFTFAEGSVTNSLGVAYGNEAGGTRHVG